MQPIDDLKPFKNIVFWQRVVAFMLLISIVGAVLFFFYNFFDSHEYQMIIGGSEFDLYMGFIVGSILLVGLGLIVYLNRTLFRAAQSLQSYLFSTRIEDLEKAIKYQKTFWQLVTLSPFIAIGLLILMLVGAIAVEEIIMNPNIEPRMIEMGSLLSPFVNDNIPIQ